MKKLFLGALILTTLLITGCKSEKEKEKEKIDKLFEIDESLSGEGKSANIDVMDVYGTKKKEEKKN